jgi:S-adenosylmethionine:tRNA ribosyltransferase-isomerase
VSTLAAPAPTDRLDFHLPKALEAFEPPEAHGRPRDGVRMLVAWRADLRLRQATFAQLPTFLDPGDLVVVNTSGTIPAAVDATTADGTRIVVHLSTRLDDGRWVVEPRRPDGRTTARWTGPPPRSPFALGPAGPSAAGATRATAHLDEPYGAAGRLWIARLDLPAPALTWLAANGRPIRYSYVDRPWPLEAYQNVYATEPGSAEMPSAGRPFTPDVLMHLVTKGIGVTPVVLHTGVASLESDELPYPERATVPDVTAARVNATRAAGGRVVAIGTTAVRALESAAGDDGLAHPYDGWTDLVITPERGVQLVDGLLTGWHEPEASHLLMLEAIAGRDLLERSYAESLAEGYLWHEFGDVHLILP